MKILTKKTAVILLTMFLMISMISINNAKNDWSTH